MFRRRDRKLERWHKGLWNSGNKYAGLIWAWVGVEVEDNRELRKGIVRVEELDLK